MKICHINPGCGIPIPPPAWGAVEKIIWESTQAFQKLGHEVDIRWTDEINYGEYDLVITHIANLALLLAEKEIPYVFIHHDHHAYHHGNESPIYFLNKEAIEKSIFSIVPAPYLVDYFNLPNLHYVSHGVNTEVFYPNKNSSVYHNLLMLANNGLDGIGGYDRKGFELGVKAAMARNLPITIVGPKNNENWVKENPWILGYPKLSIIYEPSNETLRQIYTSYTIFLHFSELEAGHPNLTLLEAAACGLPIVGCLDNQVTFPGMYKTTRNLNEILQGLDSILQNYSEYRNNVLNTADELSWLNHSKKIIELYEKYID